MFPGSRIVNIPAALWRSVSQMRRGALALPAAQLVGTAYGGYLSVLTLPAERGGSMLAFDPVKYGRNRQTDHWEKALASLSLI